MQASLRVCLLAVLVSSCAGTRDADAPAPPANEGSTSASAASASPAVARPRVVFLGDSLTAGLGLDSEQSIPSLLQARMDESGHAFEAVNAGVSGDTSAGGLRRLDWSLSGDVRVLVVELGANDGLRGLPTEELEKNLRQIIETARARGISVLLTGMEAPPNYGPAYTTAFREVYRTLGTMPGVTFMPFFLEGVAGDPALNQRDGIHPNPEGARRVQARVWPFLEPMLKARATK